MKFESLKRRVSITTVLQNKGYLQTLRKRGNDLVGPCPVHRGDNPNAFVVSLEKNLWHCFTRCRGGGDVIELVRRLDGSSTIEIARYLSQLSFSSTNNAACLENSSVNPCVNRQTGQTLFKPFTKRLRLHHDTPFLRNKGILPATADLFEAGAYHFKGMLAGCVAVRLHDLTEHPLGYAGRRLDPFQIHRFGKWVFPKGFPKKKILYNYHRVISRLAQPLVIVECPWAVMRLAQLTIPAVALLGITLSTQQIEKIIKWPKTILLLDGDPAGEKATGFISSQLQRYSIETSCAFLSPGLDPDDLDNQTIINLLKSHLY